MDCNENDKTCNLFGNEKVKYPVNFDLKVIMENNQTDEENIASLEKLLTSSKIPYSNFRKKQSSKGKYTSYTVGVTMESQQILEKFYIDLKEIPGVVYAV